MAAQAHAGDGPSDWVRRFAGLIEAGGRVLDAACGNGRHARWLLDRGHPVTAVDRDGTGIRDLLGRAGFAFAAADLEDGSPPPFGEASFAGVVVTNYLHRPLLPRLAAAPAPGGVLLYETFAQGNERHGRPRNPDFLLAPGELLAAVAGRLTVVCYEHGEIARPRAAVVQRICAVAAPAGGASTARRLDGAP